MERPQRADIGALVDVAKRGRVVRKAAREFFELHELHREAAPIVQRLLDAMIEPACARLEAALRDQG